MISEINNLFQTLEITSFDDIFYFIENNEVNSVKNLLQQLHPDYISLQSGCTLLGWILDHEPNWFTPEKRQIAQLLVEKGANMRLNINVNGVSMSLLERAFGLRLHDLIHTFVGKNRQNPIVTTSELYNIVDLYNSQSYSDVIILLSLGKVNEVDENGNTFLHLVLKNWWLPPTFGSVNLIDDLIFIYKANPYNKNSKGKTPLSIIEENSEFIRVFKDLAEKIKNSNQLS